MVDEPLEQRGPLATDCTCETCLGRGGKWCERLHPERAAAERAELAGDEPDVDPGDDDVDNDGAADDDLPDDPPDPDAEVDIFEDDDRLTADADGRIPLVFGAGGMTCRTDDDDNTTT